MPDRNGKAYIILEFDQSIDEIKQKLSSMFSGGNVELSKFQPNATSLMNAKDIVDDVVGKKFIWKPWTTGMTPSEFAVSDNMNCKRFVQKIEQHLNYRVPTEF
ncbi:unnamed protein product [Didymodactylos carnosus]|uniref:Uncharacterized protein n=1 Tax=Didymodactylos carnosus TaxID=1234261 RepID=A0A814VC50_9BILA|nr:unnamed protein product [Didymodactylos carnosus]CAF3949161.1 unnamed protein product [Didymodactylos carnosus]